MEEKDSIKAPLQEEGISLKDLILNLQALVKYLWSKWLIILLVGLSGGGIGLWKSINTKPIYIAKLNFMLENAKCGSLGGLAKVNLGGSCVQLFEEAFQVNKAILTHIMKNLLLSKGKMG